MSDLKKRLLPMEHLEMPELWADIERRRPAFQPDGPEPRWRRVGIVVAALAIAVGAVALAVNALSEHADRPGNSPTTPAPLAQNGVIAFGSIAQEGLFWTIQPDGSDRRVVRVDVPGYVGVPSWSPDGTQIAFTLQSYDDPHPEGGNYDIYTADADGSNPLRLTHDQTDRSAVWSPDGTRIAYVNESSTPQIWVMNTDGSDARQLTDGEDAVSPSWSPDGSQIAFVSWEGSDANVYVVNADGSDVRRLTNDPSHEGAPVWSPDGRSIAFASDGGSRDPGIYTIRPDGTGTTELLSEPDPANLGFAWSPDGTSMAVVSITAPDNQRTLSVMDVATRQLTPIADPGAYFGPSWQPLPPSTDPTTADLKSVPDVTGLPFDQADHAIQAVDLVPDLLRGDPTAAGAVVVEQDPAPGTEVDTGFTVLLSLSAPGEGSKQAVAIDGIPFPVCRPVTIDGDFGGGMDRAWVFEEERVPGAGCVGSEGFQRLGVGSGDRVEILSDRITDITTDRAYKVWPYATPDLDGDGVDEIALAKGEAPGSRLIWFVKVVGPDLVPVVRACGPGPGCEFAWNTTIGAIGHQNGAITQAGMYCEPQEGGGFVLVEWGLDADDTSMVSETRWTLREQTLQLANRQSYPVADSDSYPPSGLDELCGSSVSIPGVPMPPQG